MQIGVWKPCRLNRLSQVILSGTRDPSAGRSKCAMLRKLASTLSCSGNTTDSGCVYRSQPLDRPEKTRNAFDCTGTTWRVTISQQRWERTGTAWRFTAHNTNTNRCMSATQTDVHVPGCCVRGHAIPRLTNRNARCSGNSPALSLSLWDYK